MQVRFRYGLRLCSGELTTPGYPDAAPLRYKGVRTTPFAGLEPARLVAVTAYNLGVEPAFSHVSRLTSHALRLTPLKGGKPELKTRNCVTALLRLLFRQ